MKITLKILFGLAAAVLLCNTPANAASSAKVTAKVVDENGIPMKGADVTAWFTVGKPGGWGTDSNSVTGQSDKDGLFTATGDSGLPQVTLDARNEGYYTSSNWAKFTSKSLLNRWEPWNPTVEVVLKKKRKPVGMYARYTGGIKVPILDKPVGYDLEKGDWVAPYGSGMTSDFVIKFNADFKSISEYTCGFTLSFSNDLDGIKEFEFDSKDQSYYKWPFAAPVDGYLKNLSRIKSDSPDKGYATDLKKGAQYIFRVRTKVDKNGKIISANYGKIPREFDFDPFGVIGFPYYLNPDGTTNLEFDPDKNLFPWKTRDDKQDHELKDP